MNRSNCAGRAGRITFAVVGLAAMVALTACGGGKSAGAGVNSPTSPSVSSTPKGGIGSNGGAGGRPVIPSTVGIAAAVAPGRIEVQDPTSGQTTVTYSATTTFTQQKTVTEAAVTSGVCIAAVQASPGAASPKTPAAPTSPAAPGAPISMTATAITITTPVAGSCTAVGGRGGFGGVASGQPTAPASRFPTGSAGNRGAAGGFGGLVAGKVTSVSGTTIAVQSTDRRTQQIVNDTVTVTPATRYLDTVSTTSAAVTVGECIQAIGPADSTGAVAATRIGISSAVNGTCASGVRGPGFGRAGQSGVTGG